MGRVVRCVPQLPFDRGRPPSYFFTSGNAARCNPAGVECLYFSEEEATANAEYRRSWKGMPAEHQPKLIYFAKLHLASILDLADPQVVHRLHLTDHDLYGSWLRRGQTRLQRLGRAISAQRKISAVRFPSAAAKAEGMTGWNIAIFKAALTAPDGIEILGDVLEPIQVLP